MALDWNGGYSSGWRVDRVDKATWEPCGTLGGIDSAVIERDGTDAAPLLEAATMAATLDALEAFEPGWHRITMEAVQGTSGESVPIATVWLDSSAGLYDKGYRSIELTGRSVLRQAAEAKAGNGSYAPKGADGALWAADALRVCIDAPVSAAGGFELQDNIVFDLDASVLAAVWAVLNSAGWCIQIDGRGEVSILPLPTEPALSIDRETARIVMPKVRYSEGGVTYEREYAPGVVPFSVVSGAMPERGLDGLYRVRSQKLTCGKGVRVEETAEAI